MGELIELKRDLNADTLDVTAKTFEILQAEVDELEETIQQVPMRYRGSLVNITGQIFFKKRQLEILHEKTSELSS